MKAAIKKYLLLIALLISFSGCLTKTLTVSVSPSLQKHKPNTFAIFPFTFPSESQDISLKHKNAISIMTDSFETAFMGTGYSIVERRKIESVLKEIKFSYTGHVDSRQLQEIGNMTNTDSVIIGMIRKFHPAQFNNPQKPDKATKCTTVSFSVKAIHIESGEILWKGSVTRSTGFFGDLIYNCDYDILKYSDKIARDVVRDIIKKSK